MIANSCCPIRSNDWDCGCLPGPDGSDVRLQWGRGGHWVGGGGGRGGLGAVGGGEVQGRVVVGVEGVGVGAALQQEAEDVGGGEGAERVVLDDGAGVARGGEVEEGGAAAARGVEFDEGVDELLQLEGLLGRAVAHGLGDDDEEVDDDDEGAVEVGHVEGGGGGGGGGGFGGAVAWRGVGERGQQLGARLRCRCVCD